MERIEALTGMRGLASLMVLAYHVVLFYWLWQLGEGSNADAFLHPASVFGLGAGWLGVDFFFVLSGFLLARPLLRLAGTLTRREYREFAAKRLLRIAPPYYAALLLAFALAGWSSNPIFHFTWPAAIYHVLYIHTWFPEHQFSLLPVAWTLGVELQFYLLLPLLILPFRRFGPVVALPFAAVAVAYLVYVHDPSDFFRDRFLTYQFPAFLGHFGLGIAAAQLELRQWRSRVQPDAVIGVGLVAFVAVPAVILGYTKQFLPVEAPLYSYFVRLLAAVFFALVIVFALQPRSLAGRLFTLRPLIWLGEASYSLYLVHASIAGFLLVSKPSWVFADLLVFGAVLVPTSLVVAALFYFLVERPSLQLKEAVARRLGGTPRPRGLDPAP